MQTIRGLALLVSLFFTACNEGSFDVEGLKQLKPSVGLKDEDTKAKPHDQSHPEAAQHQGNNDDVMKKNPNVPEKSKDDTHSECSALIQVATQESRIPGNQTSQTLDLTASFATKITGNQNHLHLKISNESSIPMLCLEISGNQSEILIEVHGIVQHIGIKVRGNQAKTEIRVSENAVIETLDWDDAGNNPSLILNGPGTYPCPESQKKSSILCQ
jgi:hypothetical protein